jgi:acyl-lipid omega-6 desaturase (Delta-12 desaturase)
MGTPPSASADTSRWRHIVSRFQRPSRGKATWQLLNTLGPYAALWYAIYRSIAVSYWITGPLAVLAAAFLVRIFIIFHDCGHGSFYASRSANRMVGFVTGLLTLTPYFHWRWQHALHHGTSGDLDRRGAGDIWMLTVQEYLDSSRWRQFAYRLARNPIVLFVIAPFYLFVIHHRFSSSAAPGRERRSVRWMNLAIAVMACGMSLLMGLKAYLVVQIGVSTLAGAAGIWLFYVQHQFEGAYWQRRDQWNYTEAALLGSSFYKLPRVLQWFSGSIGFHHIHHLSPFIANYHLQQCHDADDFFAQVKPITLVASLRSLAFRLWDEQHKRLVGYRALAPGLGAAGARKPPASGRSW